MPITDQYGRYVDLRRRNRGTSRNGLPIIGTSRNSYLHSQRPKSLANLAVKSGLIAVPDQLWENDILRQLRFTLATNGVNYCGGLFVKLERSFSAIDREYCRRIDRNNFKQVISSSSSAIPGNQLDYLFDLVRTAEGNKDADMIDIDFFLLCLRVS